VTACIRYYGNVGGPFHFWWDSKNAQKKLLRGHGSGGTPFLVLETTPTKWLSKAKLSYLLQEPPVLNIVDFKRGILSSLKTIR
jgi:hypothetical protein